MMSWKKNINFPVRYSANTRLQFTVLQKSKIYLKNNLKPLHCFMDAKDQIVNQNPFICLNSTSYKD